MSTRRPTPADRSSPLPSIDDLHASPGDAPAPSRPAAAIRGAVRGVVPVTVTLVGGAAGLAVAGVTVLTAPPTCRPTRLDEVDAHRDAVAEHLARMEVRDTLKEIAIAMGWVPHGTTRAHAALQGEPAPVTTTPPSPPAPPTPPPAPPETRDVDGAVRPVQPAPPRTQRPPRDRPAAVVGRMPVVRHDGRPTTR